MIVASSAPDLGSHVIFILSGEHSLGKIALGVQHSVHEAKVRHSASEKASGLSFVQGL